MTNNLVLAGNITFTRTGMVPVGLDTDYEAWFYAGLKLREAEDSYQTTFAFCWGDWLDFGETRYGETYTQAMQLAGKSYSTLANYKWTARNTPTFLRSIPHLHFRHFQDAIRVRDLDERWKLLLWASINRLSVQAMGHYLPGGGQASVPPPGTADDTRFELLVENHQLKNELVQRTASDDNIRKARDILEEMTPELSDDQARKIEQALEYLRPITAVEVAIVDVAQEVVHLYREDRTAEMIEALERLANLVTLSESSARAENSGVE